MVIRQVITLEIRNDPAGAGHFGAPRGSRTHRGVDYQCTPDKPVLSPVEGEVTKIGLPYADAPWRYVQVTAPDGNQHRMFYVKPGVSVGDKVTPADAIGTAQDITERYPGQGMLPHVHYEIRTAAGAFLDPGAVA